MTIDAIRQEYVLAYGVYVESRYHGPEPSKSVYIDALKATGIRGRDLLWELDAARMEAERLARKPRLGT